MCQQLKSTKGMFLTKSSIATNHRFLILYFCYCCHFVEDKKPNRIFKAQFEAAALANYLLSF